MARRFARRRKPRVVWLPVLGNDLRGGETAGLNAAPGANFTLLTETDGSINWDARPVTFDYTEDASDTQYDTPQFSKTLQDLVTGNEYRLRRIVGKLHAFATPGTDQNPAMPALEFAAGFIVCRTDDEGTPTTDFDFVNPLQQDAAEDPWIWRRKWVLATAPLDDNNANPTWNQREAGHYPGSTAGYGSVADGPHIDQKTARVIHRSERLYFVIASRVHNPAGVGMQDFGNAIALGNLDLRLLASIRSTSSGNRGNASR